MSKLKYLVPKQELFSKLQKYSEAQLAQTTKYSQSLQDRLIQIKNERSDIEAEYSKQQSSLATERELETLKANEDWNKAIKLITDSIAEGVDARKAGEKYISSIQNKTEKLFETYKDEVGQTYSSMGNHLKIAINAIFEV